LSGINELEEFNEWIAEPKTPVCQSNRTSSDGEGHLCGIDGMKDVKMWASYGGDRYSPCEHSEPTLPPGQYTIDYSDSIGLHFHLVHTNVDDLLDLPDSTSEHVIDEVKTFWTRESHFRRFGFLWKRGILLWGPPGSGKSVTVQMISKFVESNGGIAIYVVNPKVDTTGLRLLRQIEPSRPVVVILEDIDAIISNYGESSLLALLDGELQIDNIIFVATTNYPERLDKRFINRPSRFDLVKKIGMPSHTARETYIKMKNKRLSQDEADAELRTWVNNTEGFSIAHLKELIVSVEVFEVNFDVALSRLRKMMDAKLSSEVDETSTFGFIKIT
jgi:energy-coupling factor transporter ATP-binding protein EcfA2